MRDDALDTSIPEHIEPSPYYRKALEREFAILSDVQSWDETQTDEEAKAAYAKALERHSTQLTESDATRDRYESLLACVEDWTPPTPDHEGLKDFMQKQLLESIKFDCSFELPIPTSYPGCEYRHNRLCRILEEIEYHAKQYREELERSRERTQWISDLRVSLGEQNG